MAVFLRTAEKKHALALQKEQKAVQQLKPQQQQQQQQSPQQQYHAVAAASSGAKASGAPLAGLQQSGGPTSAAGEDSFLAPAAPAPEGGGGDVGGGPLPEEDKMQDQSEVAQVCRPLPLKTSERKLTERTPTAWRRGGGTGETGYKFSPARCTIIGIGSGIADGLRRAERRVVRREPHGWNGSANVPRPGHVRARWMGRWLWRPRRLGRWVWRQHDGSVVPGLLRQLFSFSSFFFCLLFFHFHFHSHFLFPSTLLFIFHLLLFPC